MHRKKLKYIKLRPKYNGFAKALLLGSQTNLEVIADVDYGAKAQVGRGRRRNLKQSGQPGKFNKDLLF